MLVLALHVTTLIRSWTLNTVYQAPEHAWVWPSSLKERHVGVNISTGKRKEMVSFNLKILRYPNILTVSLYSTILYVLSGGSVLAPH